MVQCTALVETNHGILNLIMNQHACYGKGHTIHSSGQIEWFKNSVDDRSVQVGGKQRICTIDGYAMPFTCRGGLMYLTILGKPTEKIWRGTQLYTLQNPTYQAYQVPCPQDSTMIPERTINHHYTYHIAQASQAKHGSHS